MRFGENVAGFLDCYNCVTKFLYVNIRLLPGWLARVEQTDTNAWANFDVADKIDWRRGCSKDENKITIPVWRDSPGGLDRFGWN
jgi:hypothetical protein